MTLTFTASTNTVPLWKNMLQQEDERLKQQFYVLHFLFFFFKGRHALHNGIAFTYCKIISLLSKLGRNSKDKVRVLYSGYIVYRYDIYCFGALLLISTYININILSKSVYLHCKCLK